MDILLNLIGRFHPLIIHLPIGFILIGLLIEINSQKFKSSNKILKFIFLWSSITCFISVLTGFLQYQNEGLLWESIQNHFISGIITLLLSVAFYFYLNKSKPFTALPRKVYTIGIFFNLLITGHLGGNITHGEDHLIEPLPDSIKLFLNKDSVKEEYTFKNEIDINKPVFNNLIQPILDSKCVSCHNSKKSKGKLMLNNYEVLKKGGKNGLVINFKNPELSEILVRIHLPKSEKKHMPPKAKKQLTKAEINILSHWINMGAPENTLIKDMEMSDELLSNFIQKEESFFPEIDIDIPNKNSISFLRKKGILIAPITKSSNLLYLSSYNYHEFIEEDISELNKLKNNLVDIDLSNSSFNDEVFEILSAFKNLTRLKLNYTSISGKGIEKLSSLKNLKKLHLINTNFNSNQIEVINSFPALEKAYLFQNDRDLSKEITLADEDIEKFDFGGYTIQELP
ncbi:MAG: c-type cytochrome domain-containing protein [Flavobacteriaceae bacterium]